ncbi:MAG TPA: FHA domain-containing protein [Anaerolineaceae bacterium]
MTGIVLLILRIALVASLYGFLGWALMTIWRDLRAQGQSISAPSIPALSFTPVEEGRGEPQTLVLAEIIVGRSANCDYAISDETVSVRHTRLSYHHNQWWVEDLKSTNGTFLNDERVSVPTVIVTGDELRCGQVQFILTIEEKGR